MRRLWESSRESWQRLMRMDVQTNITKYHDISIRTSTFDININTPQYIMFVVRFYKIATRKIIDTRLGYANNALMEALLYNRNNKLRTLELIGQGLHSLQDIFAHGRYPASSIRHDMDKRDVIVTSNPAQPEQDPRYRASIEVSVEYIRLYNQFIYSDPI